MKKINTDRLSEILSIPINEQIDITETEKICRAWLEWLESSHLESNHERIFEYFQEECPSSYVSQIGDLCCELRTNFQHRCGETVCPLLYATRKMKDLLSKPDETEE